MDFDDVRDVLRAFPGTLLVESGGDLYAIHDPDGDYEQHPRQGWATVMTSDAYDTASELSRPGVFRLNIGLTRARFRELIDLRRRTTPQPWTRCSRIRCTAARTGSACSTPTGHGRSPGNSSPRRTRSPCASTTTRPGATRTSRASTPRTARSPTSPTCGSPAWRHHADIHDRFVRCQSVICDAFAPNVVILDGGRSSRRAS